MKNFKYHLNRIADSKTYLFILIVSYILLQALGYHKIGSLSAERHLNYGPFLELTLDKTFPFLPFFIFPYILTWIYPAIAIFFCIKANPGRRREVFTKFLFSLIILTIMTYLCYLLFPTHYPYRVDLKNLEDDPVLSLVSYIYQYEPNWNEFPSSHIAFPYLILKILLQYVQNRLFLIPYGMMFILTVISVLAIKMHFVLDILGGILLAEVLFIFFFKKFKLYSGDLFNRFSRTLINIKSKD